MPKAYKEKSIRTAGSTSKSIIFLTAKDILYRPWLFKKRSQSGLARQSQFAVKSFANCFGVFEVGEK
jgi:hypothetical protein